MTTFYADISEFQTPVTDAYPYPVLAARVDTGYRLDNHLAANWAHAKASAKIQVFIGYVVFIPGQRAQILARVTRFFGPSAPAKLVLMIDMESGQGFAGPGNHSAEANALAQDFATYLGSQARVVGYANHYDFQSCWPTRPPWLKLITASYGISNPGTFGWQFYGGVPNPRPSGYPNSCPPFGTNVDLNAIQLPLAGVVDAFGLAANGFLMALTDQQQHDLYARIMGGLGQRYYTVDANGVAHSCPANAPGAIAAHPLDTLDGNAIMQAIAAVKAEVDAIKKKDGA